MTIVAAGMPTLLDKGMTCAVHAIRQRERMRAAHGFGRYSLWTGDAGLAIYLWHVLNGADAFPSLDIP